MNKIDLNGRCAVVTGGAQGFGRAIAERFAASGAKVAIWITTSRSRKRPPRKSARKSARRDRAEGRRHRSRRVEKTRDETLKAFGKIDILVNNAGIAGVNRRCGDRSR